MKFVKILSLLLALLTLVSVFAACGDTPAETTGENKKPTADNDRELIEDSVPMDLNYNGETVTFFVRMMTSSNTSWLAKSFSTSRFMMRSTIEIST